jgi:hypothetical protein
MNDLKDTKETILDETKSNIKIPEKLKNKADKQMKILEYSIMDALLSPHWV